jgi:hypothetical protein
MKDDYYYSAPGILRKKTGKGEEMALLAGIIDFAGAEEMRDKLRKEHFKKMGYYA